MTFVRNCPSCATEVLGADNGAECVAAEDFDGIDDVVVAADPAWPPAVAINPTANRTQAEATNRRGLHPAGATSPALQISSRKVVPRQLRHLLECSRRGVVLQTGSVRHHLAGGSEPGWRTWTGSGGPQRLEEENRLEVVKIPIACALEPGAARSQLGEWQDTVRQAVGSAVRVSSNRLELGLLPGAELERIVGLAQRESACCPFFTFSLRIHAERLTLVVEATDDAVEVLDQIDSRIH